MVSDMIRVNFLKEDSEVFEILNLTRIFTDIIVKVGETIVYMGVFQDFVCTAGKILKQRKNFRFDVIGR